MYLVFRFIGLYGVTLEVCSGEALGQGPGGHFSFGEIGTNMEVAARRIGRQETMANGSWVRSKEQGGGQDKIFHLGQVR